MLRGAALSVSVAPCSLGPPPEASPEEEEAGVKECMCAPGLMSLDPAVLLLVVGLV